MHNNVQKKTNTNKRKSETEIKNWPTVTGKEEQMKKVKELFEYHISNQPQEM